LHANRQADALPSINPLLMKTIIAATDYTELAENAVEYAASVARANKVRLILLNDYSIPVHASNAHMSAAIVQKMLDRNEARLKERAMNLAKLYEIEVIHKSTFSFVEDEVENLITEFGADLVVMGMGDKTIWQDLWGNKTTDMIQKKYVPVMAVPLSAKFENTKRVLFACDVLHGISKLLLARVKNLAVTIHAELEVLLINETIEKLKLEHDAHKILQNIDLSLEGANFYYKHEESDQVIASIKKEIERFDADLLIMVPEQHGFWDSVIHRSKTLEMASGLGIPLLSIPI
jgi:nucleotide-binding universal stress UspA family protein